MQADYGKLLREKRESRNLSIRKLAKMTGVTHETIYKWETGQMGMRLDSADKVFRALGMRIMIEEAEE